MVVALAMAPPGVVNAVLNRHQAVAAQEIQVTIPEQVVRPDLVQLQPVTGLSLAPLIPH